MRKLLSFIGVASLIIAPTITIIACKPKTTPKERYFDSEINSIDPQIRNQVKYTSSIAKMLIASRHENMNTYANPSIDYFLNNMGNNINGIFTTKSGEDIKISEYIDGYKKLNNVFWNSWHATSRPYEAIKNDYALMVSMAGMNNFAKWNTEANNSHPSATRGLDNRVLDFEVNSNVAWAKYDTGAMVNLMSQKSKSVLNYIKSWEHYFSSSSEPGSQNILFHNSLANITSPTQLSYSQAGGDDVHFGKAIANQSSSLFDLFGLKYFNLALSSLNQFGRGTELQTFHAFNQLLPFTNAGLYGETTSNVFLAAPFVLLSLAKDDWFDAKTGLAKDNSPLIEVFDRSIIDGITLKVENVSEGEGPIPDSTVQDLSLYKIFQKIGFSLPSLLSNKKQYLDLTQTGHSNEFIKWYVVLGDWFKEALKKQGGNFDVTKFNTIITAAVSEKMIALHEIINGVSMIDTAAALLQTITKILQQPNIDMYNFIRGIAGFGNYFYTGDKATGKYALKKENVQAIADVYNASETMDGFNKNLSDVDPKSKYGELVLDRFGLERQTDQYKEGTLFYMFNIWAHGGSGIFPEHEAMHEFMTKILDSENGYIGQLLKSINKAMRDDWFDNIFLDNKWYINATGIGSDGTTLGAVLTDGKLTGVRYQMDYYGPKDASTKLEKHKKPIGYIEPYSGNSPAWIPQAPIENQQNIAPEGETWTEDDWIDYDGTGDRYRSDSEKVKYSYVVQFDNQLRSLYGSKYRNDLEKNTFLLTDFSWYYNNARYY